MSKFDSVSRDEIVGQIMNSVSNLKESPDQKKQAIEMALAKGLLLSRVDVVDLSTKELLLLSFYVRQALENYRKGGFKVLPAEEAAANWFLHVTGYQLSDFRHKMGNSKGESGLPTETSKLIDRLREKFNRGDDN